MQQPHLLERARGLRKSMSPFEARLWDRLSRSQLGHKFRRQHVIEFTIVDFFCPAKALIVEVDGDTHDAKRDRLRDGRHAHAGYTTLRFTNAQVGKDIDGVIEFIANTLTALPDRWPHPSIPSPEGEGKAC